MGIIANESEQKRSEGIVAQVKNYATGDRNAATKLSDSDCMLMVELHDSYKEDLASIDSQIQQLKEKRMEIKRRMRRSVIADMFGISEVHCSRIINGDQRGRVGTFKRSN